MGGKGSCLSLHPICVFIRFAYRLAFSTSTHGVLWPVSRWVGVSICFPSRSGGFLLLISAIAALSFLFI